MQPWRVLPFMTSNGSTNMAIDEAILHARIEELVPNTLRFYRWDPSCATIGRNQSVELEIDTQAANVNGVSVIRRISGGGAVYHDHQAEITYAVIAANEDLRAIYSNMVPNSFFGVTESYAVITQALIQGLNLMGFSIDPGIVHCPALFLEDKKISGNAQARKGGIILQHGTLLLHVNPELMYTILKAPEGVTKRKMVRSVRAKVKGLYDECDITPLSDEDFQSTMIQGFKQALGITFNKGELTEKERNSIQKFKDTRYSTKKWLNKIP